MITNEEELAEFLGEGFHTALRKASDSSQAKVAWDAIAEMPDDEWSRIISFVASATWPAIIKD